MEMTGSDIYNSSLLRWHRIMALREASGGDGGGGGEGEGEKGKGE